MKNRYEKFVLEAEKGIVFDVSDGENGELIIRALMVDKPVTSDVVKKEKRKLQPVNASLNYQNPPIPNGFRHVCGEWSHGFVIERITDGSQFVWVPVGFLPANGTIDGKTFDKQFGRRNFLNDKFAEEMGGYYETTTFNLSWQISSVEKYGGFYISRYYISIDKKTGETHSIKDGWPLLRYNNYDRALSIANSFERSDSVKSHLLFGAEYDSVLEWFLALDVKTLQEIVEAPKIEERFFDDCLEKEYREKHKTNNIYDFDLLRVWTQEREYDRFNPDIYRIVRGGGFFSNKPVAERRSFWANDPEVDESYYSTLGIRVALSID